MTRFIMTMALSGLTLAGSLLAADFKDEIAAVKNGARADAHAIWWGFNPEDATECLQQALDSGAKKVVVDNTGAAWNVGPIVFPSDIEVVFNDGVVVQGITGRFEDPGKKHYRRRLFEIQKQKNVTLRGLGTVKLTKPDDEKHGQMHLVHILDSSHVSVINFDIGPASGDCVYVGSRDCHDIHLENLRCRDGWRQGISVTGVRNLMVKDCQFNDTAGTMPQCGLDIEPNYPDGTGSENIVFENCEFSRNQLAGIQISNNSEQPTTITFRDCVIRDNGGSGISLGHTAKGNPAQPGFIQFINCVVSGHRHSSVTMGEHIVPNLKIIFKDCTIDNRQASNSAVFLSSDSPKDVHGIEIDNLTVIDDQDRPPIVFSSRYANALVNPKITRVVRQNSQGETWPFDVDAFVRASAPNPEAKAMRVAAVERGLYRPAFPKGEPAGANIRFRGSFDYYVHARPGDAIDIDFTYQHVHAFHQKPIPVVMSTPTVPNAVRFNIPYDEPHRFQLRAEELGVYKFEVNAGIQTVRIACAAPGQGVASSDRLYLFGCSGTLFFAVPAGAEKVLVEVSGSLREESSAWLQNQHGDVVDSGLRLAGGKLLTANRAQPGQPEIWSLRFNASKLFVRLAAPCLPILATAPANLLVQRDDVGKYQDERRHHGPSPVRNGEFRDLAEPGAAPALPRFWQGPQATLDTTPDHRNHLEFTGAVTTELQPPTRAGDYQFTVRASGTGALKIIATATEQAEPTTFGPFALSETPADFTFRLRLRPKANASLQFVADGHDAKVRLSEVAAEKLP